MIRVSTLKDLAGFIESKGILSDEVLSLKVDNRHLDNQSVFIAIVGQKFNPMDHLDKVVDSNCKYVICEGSSYNEKHEAFLKEINFILVEDIESYIQELGREVARRFRASGGTIIAISGSNGKTTTKEMLSHILNSVLEKQTVIETIKNYNNHLGVPFTLFQINTETQFAIVELGSNHPGEIENLCRILEPQYGITTNIGATHLEFFHTIEAVGKEESTLKDYCSNHFFLNQDDHYLASLKLESSFITFGRQAQVKIELNENGVEVDGNQLQNDKIMGEHNFWNLAVSYLVAREVLDEVKSQDLINAAGSFSPTSNRSEWIERGETKIFLDAYNANPSSMEMAANQFLKYVRSKLGGLEHVALIIGDMNELGDNARDFHQRLGASLASYEDANLFFVGRYAQSYFEGAGVGQCFDSVDQLLTRHPKILNQFKYLFIKGSRSLQLETILDI